MNLADTPLVSVLMPVYNTGAYLKEAIDSILAQTYPNIEFIIVNDGSTDNSDEVVRSYSDPRIKYVVNEKNSGIVFTRNRAFEMSTGKYVAIMDSDDVVTPDKVALQVRFMEANPQYVMCACWYKRIDSKGKLLDSFSKPKSDLESHVHLILENFFCHPSVMIKGDLARSLRYDPAFVVVEDYELYYRLSKIGPIATLPVYTNLYRIHGENISIRKRDAMFKVLIELNRIIFRDNGISCTDDEMLMHTHMLYYEFDKFSSDERMNALEDWIRRFAGHFKNKDKDTQAILLHILFEKWLVICSRSGHSSRIFRNKLIAISPSVYLSELANKFLKNMKKIGS